MLFRFVISIVQAIRRGLRRSPSLCIHRIASCAAQLLPRLSAVGLLI